MRSHDAYRSTEAESHESASNGRMQYQQLTGIIVTFFLLEEAAQSIDRWIGRDRLDRKAQSCGLRGTGEFLTYRRML
jgi:sorbitol-specific phosphotransferase system component IIC